MRFLLVDLQLLGYVLVFFKGVIFQFAPVLLVVVLATVAKYRAAVIFNQPLWDAVAVAAVAILLAQPTWEHLGIFNGVVLRLSLVLQGGSFVRFVHFVDNI